MIGHQITFDMEANSSNESLNRLKMNGVGKKSMLQARLESYKQPEFATANPIVSSTMKPNVNDRKMNGKSNAKVDNVMGARRSALPPVHKALEEERLEPYQIALVEFWEFDDVEEDVFVPENVPAPRSVDPNNNSGTCENRNPTTSNDAQRASHQRIPEQRSSQQRPRIQPSVISMIRKHLPQPEPAKEPKLDWITACKEYEMDGGIDWVSWNTEFNPAHGFDWDMFAE